MTATVAPPQPSPIGTALRTLRKTAGLTLDDVSKIGGVSPAYISKVENGLVSPTPTWISTFVESIGKHIDSAA